MIGRPGKIDVVEMTVAWRRLAAYVDEATVTLLRSAFSRVITDAGDFSCALFDLRGQMVVQPSQGLPAFIGCLCLTVAQVAAAVSPDLLHEGDSYILNDPWLGTGQLNDLTLVTPLFHRGCLIGFAANVAHASDLGGRVLSADATELFEEGLRLPLMRAYIAGEPNRDLFQLLRLNSRVPDLVIGDLEAQMSANRVVGQRLAEFLNEHPELDFQCLAAAMVDHAEAAMRLAIRQLPDGRHAAELLTDGFDAPLRLAAQVEIRGEEIFVDYTGTAPQTVHGINCCLNYTVSETVFPLICVAQPSGLINGGTLRPLHVAAPAGCVLNPEPPAPLGARTMVSQFLQAVVFRALVGLVPARVVADCGTPAWLPVLAGRNGAGQRFVEMMFLNGGFGAGVERDGISCLGWPASFSGTPVEFTESEKPLLIRRKELIPDSGGAGRRRGGLGQVFEWESRAQQDLTFAVRGDRVNHPPLGLAGGMSGRAARVLHNGKPIHSKQTITVAPGDVILLETPGSGGFGDARRREHDAVVADIADGYVTRVAAETLYGYDASLGSPCACRAAALAQLAQLDTTYLLHSLGGTAQDQADLAILAGGSGAELVDTAGRRYLDAVSGVWNACLGYGVKGLADAAGAEFARLGFGSTYAGFSNEPAIKLAAKLSEVAGRGLTATFFTSSGADANEAAFKTARFYWHQAGRPKKSNILYLEHGFAGMTLATMSASGIGGFSEMFGPRVTGFLQVPSPYPYRCGFAQPNETAGAAAARLLERRILDEGADTIAALIIEVVQGAGGVIVMPPDYLSLVREICTRHDILLIVDEVITGFGRTGRWFAMQHVGGFRPDMLTFGKAATAGHLPLGGLIVSSHVAEAIRAGRSARWMHSSTFSGNPVCCAVALKVLDIIERDTLLQRVEWLGNYLMASLNGLMDLRCVGEVRGIGLIAGVELVADPASRIPFPLERAVGRRVREQMKSRGVLVRNRDDVINLAPAYVTSETQIERIVTVLREAAKQWP